MCKPLYRALKAQKLSQSALARAIGVTPGTIWQILNADLQVPAERVLPICKALAGAVMPHQLRPDLYPEALGRALMAAA
jgi:DNA-binding transcriptional regulator YdaS (Cro superfamily)